MNTKLIINCMAVSTLLVGGCTSQTNKPPPGYGHTGPVSEGQGAGGQQYAGGGNGSGGNTSGRNNGRGNGANGRGTGQGGSGGNGYVESHNQNRGGGYGVGGRSLTQNGNGSSVNDQGRFGGGSAYGGTTKSSYTPADLRDPRSILAQRIIYFGYNKSAIKAQYRQILNAHGALLADFPELNVRLEGHADERGSREYNVALSEHRAYSVLDYLKIKGVKTGQADIVGYGEEVPATFGHGEGSWNKNRRVEIIYAGE